MKFICGKGKLILAGAICVTIASQINIGLFGNGFKVSAGILLLPLFAFYIEDFPIFITAVIASPLVFLLRRLVYILSSPGGDWYGDAPEMVFYLCYGFLLAIYLRKISLHPCRIIKMLPLIAVDFFANFAELTVRMGSEVFSIAPLLQLLAIGVVRASIISGMLFALEGYGFSVLREEDSRRYQRLLLMTSMLHGELAWMRKNTVLVEHTMNNAYGLYSDLRDKQPDSEQAATALSIAKDIHEVKKEYLLIVRGVTEALERESIEDGMHLSEIWDILITAFERTIKDSGKICTFEKVICRDFYTKRHFELLSIFRNLLNNALEAAKNEAIKISLKQSETDEEWLFEVYDNCGGIPKEYQDKIFVEGFSSKINYSTGEINRGLGLALVHDLVEETLSGTIQFESGDGKTIFFLRFPKKVLGDSL